MKTNEIFKLIDAAFLEKMYAFSYRRCDTSHEAEDLCSQIIVAVISALQKAQTLDSFYGFVWTIAHRVYADYCDKRNKEHYTVSLENVDRMITSADSETDAVLESAYKSEQLKRILYEITFLSKIYRDVTVMYYLDEIKIKDIAEKLGITETTVKQRLFSARNTIKKKIKNEVGKEVIAMKNKNLSLKPVRFSIMGTGCVNGNDPRSNMNRTFSQNLIYLCKDKPKTAKELSEELCVPMLYVEEELEIQVRGANGEYGTLRKLDNGKYITNVIVADYNEYYEANSIYEKHVSEFVNILKNELDAHKEEILGFPYLSRQNDMGFILWSLISRIIWGFQEDIIDIIKKEYFADIEPAKRPFSMVCVAYNKEDHENLRFDFYGCDGIFSSAVCSYKEVSVSNIYGKRIKKHFHTWHNLSNDEKLIMLLRSVGGIHVDSLSESEKEIAAKALECGYIRKNGDMLEPKIIVMNKSDEKAFYALANRLHENMGDLKKKIAEELAVYMKKHIPEHLICEYEIYSELIAGVFILSSTIEQCIKAGLLDVPENTPNAEGVLMTVEK